MKLGRGVWLMVLFASSFVSCSCESEEMSACMEKCDKLDERRSQCAGPDAKICKKDVGRMVDECEAECKALHAEAEEEAAEEEAAEEAKEDD